MAPTAPAQRRDSMRGLRGKNVSSPGATSGSGRRSLRRVRALVAVTDPCNAAGTTETIKA